MTLVNYFQILWMLAMVASAACADQYSCPKGSQIDLATFCCYWLNTDPSSWLGAQAACRQTPGGDLARVSSAEDHLFILGSFPLDSTLWVWVRDGGWRGEDRGGVEKKKEGMWKTAGREQDECTQMALGPGGQWRTGECETEQPSLCQKEVAVSLPSLDTLLVGVPLMSGMYRPMRSPVVTSSLDTAQHRVEMMLFPGLWFSHIGKVLSVDLVAQPIERHTYARVQILRPYCVPSQHLVPPGCGSLHNAFSCCSQEPLCNTTSGCISGQHWCHLLESCIPVESPCSPYLFETAGEALPFSPRYSANPPFYHVVADLLLELSASSELLHISVALPERDISVYPDDILAVQHTERVGGFLHCLGSSSSLWRQSYVSLQGPGWGGWIEGGLTGLLTEAQWVDGVVCDLRVLYSDVQGEYTVSPSEVGDHTHAHLRTESPLGAGVEHRGPKQEPSPVSGICLVYPSPDNRGQIHIPVSTPTLVVIKILSGSEATSSWSAPVLQTGVPFSPTCPHGPAQFQHGCERDSPHTQFSHAYLVLTDTGSHTLNVSASNAVSSQSMYVHVQAYQPVRGLTVLPRGIHRMLVDVPQVFSAVVDSGSLVEYTWVIDGLVQFAYKGETYSISFRKPAEYKLTVVADNPVSSESVEVTLTAESMIQMADPAFISVREVIAVNTLEMFTFRVKVDVAVEATFWWDFGESSPGVNHSFPSLSESRGAQLESGVRQVYLQDSVNYTYKQPGDYILRVQVINKYEKVQKNVLVMVRSELAAVTISATPPIPLVNQTFDLEAFPWPSSYGIQYTWRLGSSTYEVKGVDGKVSHVLRTAGLYNVTVTANNSLSVLTAQLVLEIADTISSLQLSCSGPDELGSISTIEGIVSSGTSLLWTFDMGDGSLFENISDNSISYTYRFPGNYCVTVTVRNAMSQIVRSINVEVYELAVNGILPSGCLESECTIYFSVLVTGNVAQLTFIWNFGDGTPVSIIQGNSTVYHIYSAPGNYEANVTLLSSVGSAFYSKNICTEPLITAITIHTFQGTIAIGEDVCFNTSVYPQLDKPQSYKFVWNSSCHKSVQGPASHCFVFKEQGTYQVSVQARNSVSNRTAIAFVTVQTPITDLAIKSACNYDSIVIRKPCLFWVDTSSATNVSVLWDFGDDSPKRKGENVSQVFKSEGRFKICATGLNAVSQYAAVLEVRVMVPLSYVTLQMEKPVVEVGEEMVVTAKTNVVNHVSFLWSIDGSILAESGTPNFTYLFPRAGIYHIFVTVQNKVSKQEAEIAVDVLERIQGVQILSKNLTAMKYLSTQQNVILTATVTHGSNLTYSWLVGQNGENRTAHSGAHLYLFTETAGDIYVELTVSNRLGKANSNVLLRAEEHVSGVTISTTKDTVATGKPVEILVSARTGTDLHFLWHISTSKAPLTSAGPSIQYIFSALGPVSVKVSVSNMISSTEATKLLLVQEEIQEVHFKINGKTNPFFVASNSKLFFNGSVQKGNYVNWEWKCFSKEKGFVVFSNNRSALYSFSGPGIFQVLLNASNDISWQTTSHKVTVQDTIHGLMLDISSHTLCAGDSIIFMPAVLTGSDVHVSLDIDNGNVSMNLIEKHFTTSSLPVGVHTVTVRAWNNVSNAAVTATVQVIDKIQGLRLSNCCNPILESNKEISFEAEVLQGTPTIYIWSFNLTGSQPSQAKGPKVFYKPVRNGSLSINVVANNGFCSVSLSRKVSVQQPVHYVRLVNNATTIFNNQTVSFSAVTDDGSDLNFKWKFGDSAEEVLTDYQSVDHRYLIPGRYVVQVLAFNNISQAVAQFPVQVRSLECTLPQVSLVQKQAIIFKSRPSYFEASVDLQGCIAYKASYLWEAFHAHHCREEESVPLSNVVDVTKPLLALPKHALAVGLYCLKFSAVLQGTPLLQQQSLRITVVHSELVPLIKGGSHRVWSSYRDLLLDGTESHDPDVENSNGHSLHYQWNCTVQHNEKDPPCLKAQSNSSTFLVSHEMLRPGRVFHFALTVQKPGRPPVSTSQSVTVQVGQVLPVTVTCVTCTSMHFSRSRAVVLSGCCPSCAGSVQYKWSAESWDGSLELSEATTSTGSASPDLVIRPGVLAEGLSYTFTLNASQATLGLWGLASITLHPNPAPHGGVCTLNPDVAIHLLETMVTYNCSGWVDRGEDTAGLMYTLKVKVCEDYRPLCHFHILYRGTRNTYGTFVPLGYPDLGSTVITVLVLVEDDFGSAVTALNRTLIVHPPEGVHVTTEWLKNKSQSRLWALYQQGNSQEVIPYTIALASQLDQIENVSEHERRDRAMIRGDVTRVLSSLPVSSLQDAAQISSALAQYTADPGELACESCQEKVLDTMARMIVIIGEQAEPGDVTLIEAGRNILHVLGSSMAADGERSGTASGSVQHNVSQFDPAAEPAVFAFDQAGVLMQHLMRSRMRGEEALMLTTPRISAVGRRGDPAGLLCTGFSATCPFHIPRSLCTQLREETEEIVQVFMDLDARGPLLTAVQPPISTTLAAMEFATPQGIPIPIQNLPPDRAIRVMLQNQIPAGSQDQGEGPKRSILDFTLPSTGLLNFSVRAVAKDPTAGLFIAFNFSILPGSGVESRGQLTITVDSRMGSFPSEHSSVRELPLYLTDSSPAMEDTIFLSPLLNSSAQELYVSVRSSLSGATVQASVCVFSSLCQYFNMQQRRWSTDGLRPLSGSSLRVTHCLTRHLSVFGASLFVHPDAVVLLPPPENPVKNVVVGIVCGVLLLLHLFLGLIAHKLDHLDSTRHSFIPLCGQPGRYQYQVLVKTGWARECGTTAHVGISLYGLNKSGSRHLQRGGAFQRNALDAFQLETDVNLGEIWKIRIWHDNTGLDPSWYLHHVIIWDRQTDNMFFFLVEDWLSVENEKSGGLVEKEVLACCPQELQQFRRIFRAQLVHGLVDWHIWSSVWQRPAHSGFTRAQRVTCCALLLHLYLAVTAVWYGAVGIKGTQGPVSTRMLMDAQTLVMGMTTAVLVCPLQLLFCFLFRKTCSKVTVNKAAPTTPVSQTVEMDIYLDQSELAGSSFLSLPRGMDSISDTGSPSTESLGSKKIDSVFWNASKFSQEREDMWPFSDSIFDLGELVSDPPLSQARLLKRRKAWLQLHLGSPTGSLEQASSLPPALPHEPLTLSEQDLLRSIGAETEMLSTSSLSRMTCESGRCSPQRTALSDTQESSYSSWSETSQPKAQFVSRPCTSASSLSAFSTASTFLPSPSPVSLGSPSETRIGVARRSPRWRFPPWMLRVTYLLAGLVMANSLALVGLYGSSFSGTALLMWLISVGSAFLTSVILLEPLKVCIQALFLAMVVRPVDPEVEEYLEQGALVSQGTGAQGGRVRPPCGYGLLHAKQEARKVRALRALMKGCVVHTLFLLVVLIVNYQNTGHDVQVKLLHSAVRHSLLSASPQSPSLMNLTRWTEVWQWMEKILVPYMYQVPSLALVGLPQLQRVQCQESFCAKAKSFGKPYSSPFTSSQIQSKDAVAITGTFKHLFSWWKLPNCDVDCGGEESVDLGNTSTVTHDLLSDLQAAQWITTMTQSVSVKFTHYHRETTLFVPVAITLERTTRGTAVTRVSVEPFHMPPSSLGPDLQLATMVLLLLFAVSFLGSEIWEVAREPERRLWEGRRCLQLLVSLLSLSSVALQLSFLSTSASCYSHLRSQPQVFVSLHDIARRARISSHVSALLLTLLVVKMVGTLRVVRRWVLFSRALYQAWRELCAVTFLLVLLLLIFAHVGCMLFSHTVEGFRTAGQAGLTLVSALRGRATVRSLCQQHPGLGPLYCMALLGAALWLLGRLCASLLLQSYRKAQADMYQPVLELQDHEMVEFFIKRLKLWMGLSKAKEFRHKVKFVGMVSPPCRSSQGSQLSSLEVCSTASLRPESAVSLCSEGSTLSEGSTEHRNGRLYLERLIPAVSSLLTQFERVNQLTDDVHLVEQQLLEAWSRIFLRRRELRDQQRGPGGRMDASAPPNVACLPSSVLPHNCPPPSFLACALASPHAALSFSKSASPWQTSQLYSMASPLSGSGRTVHHVSGTDTAFRPLPGRRAWHSDAAHSADATQKLSQAPCRARPKSEEGRRIPVCCDQIPVKKRAWHYEGPDVGND